MVKLTLSHTLVFYLELEWLPVSYLWSVMSQSLFPPRSHIGSSKICHLDPNPECLRGLGNSLIRDLGWCQSLHRGRQNYKHYTMPGRLQFNCIQGLDHFLSSSPNNPVIIVKLCMCRRGMCVNFNRIIVIDSILKYFFLLAFTQ